VSLLFPVCVNGQSKSSDTSIVITDTTSIELLFKRARELSYDKNYSLAIRICQKIIEKKPGYFEVRTFLARTYAWDKQYDNARIELSKVLIEKENDFDALNTFFDVEFWTESYSVASDYLKIALGFYPNSEELLLKKAKLQIRLEEKSEAALTLRRVLNLNPGQKEAVRLMNSLEGRKLNNGFKAGMQVDLLDKIVFNKDIVQYLYVVEYSKSYAFGSVLLRTNYANKFNVQGPQFELESYVHFNPKIYTNLLVGYSNISIFPDYNLNGEMYFKLPNGFETSAGVRYRISDKNSFNYTASLSNYYKDYWFNIRTFFTPKTDQKVRSANLSKSSITVLANIRIYFGDSDNFMGFKAGSGRSPDENKTLDVAAIRQASQGGLELQKRIINRWLMKLDVSYSKEEVGDTRFNRRISTNITLKTVF
jgi:YaiO family outer membrane protein